MEGETMEATFETKFVNGAIRRCKYKRLNPIKRCGNLVD